MAATRRRLKVARRQSQAASGARAATRLASATTEPCWLCSRPLGRRVEWHHPCPKSRGGRETVPVHPICHRTLHATFSNAELARMAASDAVPASHPQLERFLAWIGEKAPDFHAPTRRPRC